MIGVAVEDRSKAGLIFEKEPPRERIATLPITNQGFVIPPGAPNAGWAGKNLVRRYRFKGDRMTLVAEMNGPVLTLV